MNFWREVHSGEPMRKWLPSPRREDRAARLRNNVTRGGARFSKPVLMLARNIVAAASAGTNGCNTNTRDVGGSTQVETPRLWTPPKFEFVLTRDIAKCLPVAKWNPNDRDIRIRAPHTHAARLASFQPVEFRLRSHTPRRNFYSPNRACTVGLIRPQPYLWRENFYDTISLFLRSAPLAPLSPLFNILFQFP